MITLYLVRHGETDGNVKRWYQGATDIPLNARGREQAEALGRYFQDFPFQAIYSSPLSCQGNGGNRSASARILSLIHI